MNALTSILKRLPNVLGNFYRGRAMKQQGAPNVLMEQTRQMLARGVLDSPDPATAYPLALQQAERMGMDVSMLPKVYDENAQRMVKLLALPGEQSALQQHARASGLMRRTDEHKTFKIINEKGDWRGRF